MEKLTGGMKSSYKNVSNKLQALLKKTRIRNTGIILLLFFVYMVLYLSLLGEMVFVDEVEIYQNGYLISRGGILYKNVISQHMPVSYYLAAIISWFGPRNSLDYRMGFYFIMTMIYIALFFRHRRYTSPAALIVTPVFFIMVLPYISLASSMLSDHWQGIGIGILLLEMLRYIKTKRITISTAIWVSLGIQLSFGAAFLAAYAILPVMLAVFAIQIYDCVRLPRESRHDHLKCIVQEDLILVGIVLLPLVIIVLYYLFIGSFNNLIKGTYLINTEIYSHYIGGYGLDPIAAAKAPILTYIQLSKDTLRNCLSANLDSMQIIVFIMLFCDDIVSLWLLTKRHFAAGIAWLFACIMCGVRGFTGFHSMPFFFVSALSVGLVFSWCMRHMFENKNYVIGVSAIVMLAFVGHKLPTKLQQTNTIIGGLHQQSPRKKMVDTILEENDPIHITNILQMSYVFDFQRPVDFGAAISTPWTYEAYGEEELESLKTVQPKLVFYTPGSDTWGFMHDEYGKDIVMYIVQHYTQFENSDMWIRNDCVSESLKKLGVKGKNLYLGRGDQDLQYINLDEQGPCIEYVMPKRDMTILGIGLQIGNYLNNCKGVIGLEVVNENSGESIYRTAIDTAEFMDKEYNKVDTAEFTLKKDVLYSINVCMQNSEAGSLALAVKVDSEKSTDQITAYSNYDDGENWDYGIYLVEKRSAEQRKARMEYRHNRMHDND